MGCFLARKLRVFIENTPVHILLKSIDSIVLFKDDGDSSYFFNIVNLLSSKLHLDMHSYVICKTYFEFLATPKDIETLPKFMQSLGRQYVLYYNKKYNRTGTLWEGRYKSSLVEPKKYLFDVMCYIEQKVDYIYSSKNKNMFDKKDLIVTYHQEYKKLGFTQKDRLTNYLTIFKNFDKAKLEMVETSLEKQMITGSLEYIKELEKKLGLVLTTKQRGRPKKEKEKEKKIMYKNLQVLDKEKHKDLKISSLSDLNFAKHAPFIQISINEAILVGATFPIVFTSEENSKLVALVSLGGDSLAINNEGKWITQYVPSFLRKYPFSLASTKENTERKVILIDEDSSLFSKSKGKQLFTKSGEQSETLEHAINFLKENEKQVLITKNIIKEIVQSDILEERDISVGEGDEKKVLVNGFKIVDKEKLYALSDDILAAWARRGILTFIDAHLKSLENIEILFNLASQRQK
ncbi:MAG: hypothetical protein CSA86_02680 [Arcobacter sp.]|nr:MAG: hypothetical protein CSA86_02680 [Arcobacter sp.]